METYIKKVIFIGVIDIKMMIIYFIILKIAFPTACDGLEALLKLNIEIPGTN